MNRILLFLRYFLYAFKTNNKPFYILLYNFPISYGSYLHADGIFREVVRPKTRKNRMMFSIQLITLVIVFHTLNTVNPSLTMGAMATLPYPGATSCI